MDHLAGLNEAQKMAVCATDGPVLVLAGAGAGKTKTIAHRIVHLVKGGVAPRSILAITFTNKAAREMRERILALLAAHNLLADEGPTVTTFHALCAQLLRTYGHRIGIPRSFTILDRADSLRTIKRATREVGEDDKRFEPRVVLSTISRAKSDGLSCAAYQEKAGNAWFPGTVGSIWQRYDTLLAQEHALDFDDLLLRTNELLHTDVRDVLERRWCYLHVDEYQDTNRVQYDIARSIAGETRNIFCVGDVDQNVYTFRGATIENILAFETHFPDATVLKLEQNYRSTKTIVAVSNHIIQRNVRRRDKTLFTENDIGEPVSLTPAYHERDEALQVVEAIAAQAAQGVPYHDIAVLYRANFQSRVLEDACLAAGVPYRVLGTRFFDRKEVRDVLAYLRGALNRESETDLRRAINEPQRGIGKTTVERWFGGDRSALTPAMQKRIDDFFVILDDIARVVAEKPTREAVAYAIERSGIGASFRSDLDEDIERKQNVEELVSLAATRYDSLPAPEGVLRLIEDASLATDQDELDHTEQQGAVALMTVHASKGLEFSHVFITGLEDGLFPHERQDDRGAHDVEEERRLFYVALTRAQHQVHLSYALTRTVFGTLTHTAPSRFILDIPEEYLAEERAAPRGKVVYLD